MSINGSNAEHLVTSDGSEILPVSQIPNEALAALMTVKQLLSGLTGPIISETGPEHELMVGE